MTSLWISLLLLGFGIMSMAEAASEPLAEVDGIAITPEEVEKPLAFPAQQAGLRAHHRR